MRMRFSQRSFNFIFTISGSLKCFCNSADCSQDDSISCQAGYACYAEILNSTAKYGCIQRIGHTSLCVRQGSPPKRGADKQYLLLCCFKDFCNMPKKVKGNKWYYDFFWFFWLSSLFLLFSFRFFFISL